MSEPGVSLAGNRGLVYPERAIPRLAWYEKTWSSLRCRVGGGRRTGGSRDWRIVRDVTKHAETVAGLDATALQSRARALGRGLRTHGLHTVVVAEVFALVREAATRTLGLRHHEEQLLVGWLLLQGKVAEMATGEGKTLAATLAAATAALAGLRTHIVTANDYLATRDAHDMKPVYQLLGLTVDRIVHDDGRTRRRQAYQSDVVYVSSKEIAFDFLRDRVILGQRRCRLGARLERFTEGEDSSLRDVVLDGLYFAVVDEADSILIDEARTPLIISGIEAEDETVVIYRQAMALADTLERGTQYVIVPQERRIDMLPAGLDRLAVLGEDLGGIWRGPRRREELVVQALHALHLYHRGQHYVIDDGKVQIVDEYTGRVLPDRLWQQGLHQMIEVKEGVGISAPRKVMARSSYQFFFRRYLKLAGMTGTAAEVSDELCRVYGLDVATVPTHKPLVRQAWPTRVFADAQGKWSAVVQRTRSLIESGRPVLIGTRTVAASETVSRLLHEAGIPHRLLNASQNLSEAEVIAEAGQSGQVTVATNMAGRGTDIRLGPGVPEVGGLHVIATELHDARRIDRQLFGRCGRQGDPGSHELVVSLDDELPTTFLHPWMIRLAALWVRPSSSNPLVIRLMRHAQRRAERRNARIRSQLYRGDERLEDSLAFTGRGS
jgi:preprotein translocase subunit SecA